MIGFSPTTASKPYRIIFEHRPQYLFVRVQCETTNYAIAKKYWSEILSLQLQRKYERVLIDKDIINPMPTHDVVMFVSELANSGCHDVKFAIYDRNYDAQRCGFEEMVGTTRGLQVRICSRMTEAENWLATASIPADLM